LQLSSQLLPQQPQRHLPQRQLGLQLEQQVQVQVQLPSNLLPSEEKSPLSYTLSRPLPVIFVAMGIVF